MNEQLLKWARGGYAPTLLYDDNGSWAISFSGVMCSTVPEEQTFYANRRLAWCATPQEAVDAAIGREDEL